MAAASSPSASSLGTGVMKRKSRGEQTKTDPCSPLEFLLWLMFETMVALVRAVGVYVGEDGDVVDFLEEEGVEIVFEVSENLAAHYRFLLQVVGQET